MAPETKPFGNSTYTFETKKISKRKSRCEIIVQRGPILPEKWKDLPAVIEKLNDDEDTDILEMKQFDDERCIIHLDMSDGLDLEDMFGWMGDLSYKFFGEETSFDVSRINQDSLWTKAELKEGMKVCIVEVKTISTRPLVTLFFKSEDLYWKQIYLFDEYLPLHTTCILTQEMIDGFR